MELRAAREALAGEPEAADPPLEALEHPEADVHDFDADAVAGQDRDLECVVARHSYTL
jgi:hypothetical protein